MLQHAPRLNSFPRSAIHVSTSLPLPEHTVFLCSPDDVIDLSEVDKSRSWLAGSPEAGGATGRRSHTDVASPPPSLSAAHDSWGPRQPLVPRVAGSRGTSIWSEVWCLIGEGRMHSDVPCHLLAYLTISEYDYVSQISFFFNILWTCLQTTCAFIWLVYTDTGQAVMLINRQTNALKYSTVY